MTRSSKFRTNHVLYHGCLFKKKCQSYYVKIHLWACCHILSRIWIVRNRLEKRSDDEYIFNKSFRNISWITINKFAMIWSKGYVLIFYFHVKIISFGYFFCLLNSGCHSHLQHVILQFRKKQYWKIRMMHKNIWITIFFKSIEIAQHWLEIIIDNSRRTISII